MTIQTELRIARNYDMFGCCASIVAYDRNDEIGRAVYDAVPKNWLIGPSGIPDADDFAIEITIDRSLSREAMLDRVETLLRLSISAAKAATKEAA